MAQFIRCIDGHVFDAGTATVCPICGAVVEFTPPVDLTSSGAPVVDGTGVAAGAISRTPVLAALAAGVLCVGIGALFFALRETRPATNKVAPASLSASQLGDPLQMALFVTRMLTAFDQNHYTDALSQAEALAANNNPIGMRVKAQIILDGLLGQKDPVQARALLTSAVKLGDPSSALLVAPMLEQGIGGPADSKQGNVNYLFAAESNVPGASEEFARLHMDKTHINTVMQAYRTVMTSDPKAKETIEAASTLATLTDFGATPSICLSAWAVPKFLANGWSVTDSFKDSSRGKSAETLQYKAFSNGVARADPWCEWGMATLTAKGITAHPKNLVAADVFYRLAVTNGQLGSSVDQVKHELAAVEAQMTPAEKSLADGLLSGVAANIPVAAPANGVAVTTPAAAPVNNEANSDTAPPSPSQASQTPSEVNGEPSAAPAAAISDTLRTTLDVVRMLATFNQKNYTSASSQADALIDRSSPIAMFVKAGILQNGLAGQRDSAQSRALLARGAQLGDPVSTLFLARMLENGISGPRDHKQAAALYLVAARGMADAGQDIARLHLGGEVGMTAMQAYQTLESNTAGKEATIRAGSIFITLLDDDHSTSAVCLRGWMDYISIKKDASPDDANKLKKSAFGYFNQDAPRVDPWCDWGMAMLAAYGAPDYPKNPVEADVFYRLAAMNSKIASSKGQVSQDIAAVESAMTPTEKSQADNLFNSAVTAKAAP